MDCLLELRLDWSRINVVPSSIGRYCTNLLFLDLRDCFYLKNIEPNFRRLKHLKKLDLRGCDGLEIPVNNLIDVERCSHELPLYPVSQPLEENFHLDHVYMKLPYFPRFLRTLSPKLCKLGDGDIPSDICQLSSLQVLDLSQNDFPRISSSLSQLPSLKFLNLSWCRSLVDLPELPSSIAVLDVSWCDSLGSIGDFPAKYKWLWKVSLQRREELIGAERVLQSMLEGNAIEDYFLSLHLGFSNISTMSCELEEVRLQLPQNWYNEVISGFLICIADFKNNEHTIIIQEDMCMDYEPDTDLMEVFTEYTKDTQWGTCYISFNLLRHTTWWNSTHIHISFIIKRARFKVELIPRKSKDHIADRAKGACSDFWDEETQDGKTFKIEHDSKSSIKIAWHHLFL